MAYVLALAAGLWILGKQLGAPASARRSMIGLLYLAVLAALAALPDRHALRDVLGGTLGEWLVLGALAALALGYRGILSRLRARAAPAAAAAPGAFSTAETERYARHIMLREIGGPGQKKLKKAKVLAIGAGGLGAPSVMYLAAAGVGTIGVIDDDNVELTNLQRQIAHADERIGMPKAHSAAAAMKAINPNADIRPYHRRLDEETAPALFADYDLILDGSDNFATRYLANRVAARAGKPLVSAALTQWEGQISVFDSANGTPCYQCIFPEAPAPELVPSCAEAGVLGPLPGVLGSMMAVEAVKVLTGAGDPLAGRLMIYDALYGNVRTIELKKRAECPVCGNPG